MYRQIISAFRDDGVLPEWLQVRVTEPQRAAGRLEVSRPWLMGRSQDDRHQILRGSRSSRKIDGNSGSGTDMAANSSIQHPERPHFAEKSPFATLKADNVFHTPSR